MGDNPRMKGRSLDTLKIVVNDAPAGAVIAIEGEIGIIEVEELNRHLVRVLNRGPKIAVLDLSGVSMIGSAGMGALIAFRRDLGRVGGDARLAAIRPQVREALRRALFDRIFKIYDTVAQALAP